MREIHLVEPTTEPEPGRRRPQLLKRWPEPFCPEMRARRHQHLSRRRQAWGPMVAAPPLPPNAAPRMSAPMGAEVGLYWDSPTRIEPGDYLRSVSTGRTYLIQRVHVVQRGPNAGRRQYLRAVVVPADHPDPDDQVYPIRWYRR